MAERRKFVLTVMAAFLVTLLHTEGEVHLPVIARVDNVGVLMCKHHCHVRLNCCYYNYSDADLRCVLFGVACSEIRTNDNHCNSKSRSITAHYFQPIPDDAEAMPRALELVCTKAIQRVKKEAVEKQRKEALEKQRKEAVEKQRKETLEKQREEALEKQRKEALEKQREEALEKQRQEALEKQREEALEKQRQEALEKQEALERARETITPLVITIRPKTDQKGANLVVASPGGMYLIDVDSNTVDSSIDGATLHMRCMATSEIHVMAYDVVDDVLFFYYKRMLKTAYILWKHRRSSVGSVMNVPIDITHDIMAVVVDAAEGLLFYVTRKGFLYKFNRISLTRTLLASCQGIGMDIDTDNKLIYYSGSSGLKLIDYTGRTCGEVRTQGNGIMYGYQGTYVYWCGEEGVMETNMSDVNDTPTRLMIDSRVPCSCPRVQRYHEKLFVLCYSQIPQKIWIYNLKTQATTFSTYLIETKLTKPLTSITGN